MTDDTDRRKAAALAAYRAATAAASATYEAGTRAARDLAPKDPADPLRLAAVRQAFEAYDAALTAARAVYFAAAGHPAAPGEVPGGFMGRTDERGEA